MLDVRNVSCYIDQKELLKNISFQVRKGSALGLIGENGAGKSLLMRCIAGLQVIEGGHIKVFGYDTYQEPLEAKKQIGYLPDAFGLYENLKVYEYLNLFALAHGMRGLTARAKIEEIIERFELQSWRDIHISKLSRGARQQVAFAHVFLHSPNLFLLDTPSDSIDPIAKKLYRKQLMEAKKEGKIILLSSHANEQLMDICDSYLLISQGSIETSGNLKGVFHDLKAKVFLRVTVEERLNEALEFFRKLAFIKSITIQEKTIVCEYDNHEDIILKDGTKTILARNVEVWLLQQLVLHNISVSSFSIEKSSIADLYMGFKNFKDKGGLQ